MGRPSTGGSASAARFEAFNADPSNDVGGYHNLTLAEDGTLFVLPDGTPSIRIKDDTVTYPVGFRFGVALMAAFDGAISAVNDAFYDENGNGTNTYGSTANAGGAFVEVMKVAAGKWLVLSKTGEWGAT